MTTYKGLVSEIIALINLIIPAILAIFFLYFVWKIIDAWILHAGDETKRKEGRFYTLAAIVSFVLIVGIWSIVSIIRSSLF